MMIKRVELVGLFCAVLAFQAASLTMPAFAGETKDDNKIGESSVQLLTEVQPESSGCEPRAAVVRVRAAEGEAASLGTGTLVGCDDKHGVVLTNWHVVRDATGQISVRFPDGFSSAASVLETDETWDLAALLIWRPETEPVAIADEPPKRGDELTIAGFGSGTYREATGTATQYVSPGGDHPFEIVEVNVQARNGDSGGPIFNREGRLAAVLFGAAEGCTNGSHSKRVLWFVKKALKKFPKLGESIVAGAKQKPKT